MVNNFNGFRTDIAPEIIENQNNSLFNQGVKSSLTKHSFDITKHTVILEEKNAFNQKRGDYITIDSPYINAEEKEIMRATKNLLKESLKKYIFNKKNILVIGVGNDGLTSDSLGPSVILRVESNRAKLSNNRVDDAIKDGVLVSVFAPSVAGKTGIESFDIIKCVVGIVKPDLVIVVDSLCSRKLSRIGTSFQLTNVGILPGSGIGNAPSELSKKTLKVKTIAIGVPMVVYASELAIELLFDEKGEDMDFFRRIKKAIPKKYDNLVVTPKNIDEIIEVASEVIAGAINEVIIESRQS